MHLHKHLKSTPHLILPVEKKDQFHVYQMYTIQVEDGHRDALQKHLSKKGIMTKIYFDPIHLKSYYQKEFGYRSDDLPKTEALSKQVLTLPMFPSMTEEELLYIEDSINGFLS